MARLVKARSSSLPSGAAKHRQSHREPLSYKMRLETVTQKQTLKTYLTYSVRPPRGYTFIPAGDPQLTRKCKKCSKELNVAVYIVSAGASKSAELSKEIHRIGYHFANAAVDQACQALGVTLNSSGRVNNTNFNFLEENLDDENLHLKKARSKLPAEAKQVDGKMSQKLVDFLATEAIRDLFPKIPERDLQEIILRAFDQSAGLVGTAQGFSFARRASLAVGAHIRHTYTNYDKLLKSGDYTWQQARQGVEQFTLDKLVSWRDEEDDNPNIEEVLREVVVIPDDVDASVGSGAKARTKFNQRTQSPEQIDATAVDLTVSDEEDSEDDSGIYRAHLKPALGRMPAVAGTRQDREERDNLRRYDRWRQALDRQRSKPAIRQSEVLTSHGIEDPTSRTAVARPIKPTSPVGLGASRGSIQDRYHDERAVHELRKAQVEVRNNNDTLARMKLYDKSRNADVDMMSPSMSLHRSSEDNDTQEALHWSHPASRPPRFKTHLPLEVRRTDVLPSIEGSNSEETLYSEARSHIFAPGPTFYDPQQSATLVKATQEPEIVYVRSQEKRSDVLPGTRPGTILVPLDRTHDSQRIVTNPSHTCQQSAPAQDFTAAPMVISRPHDPQRGVTSLRRLPEPSCPDDFKYSEFRPTPGTGRLPARAVYADRSWEHTDPADGTSPSPKKPRLVRLSNDGNKSDFDSLSHSNPPSHPYSRGRSGEHAVRSQDGHTQARANYNTPITTSYNPADSGSHFPAAEPYRNTTNVPRDVKVSQPSHPPPAPPPPRLVRLGPAENGGLNLPAHISRSHQQPHLAGNTTSPRQIALGNAQSLIPPPLPPPPPSQYAMARHTPRQLVITQPEQPVRYISRPGSRDVVMLDQ